MGCPYRRSDGDNELPADLLADGVLLIVERSPFLPSEMGAVLARHEALSAEPRRGAHGRRAGGIGSLFRVLLPGDAGIARLRLQAGRPSGGLQSLRHDGAP